MKSEKREEGKTSGLNQCKRGKKGSKGQKKENY